MKVSHRLAPLFDYSSMAIVGASDNPGTGLRVYQIMQNLGYQGRYYPVNARSDRVNGRQAYKNVSSLPEVPEMVVIAVPREAVASVIDECAESGVKAATILAAGFLDRGDARGAELQAAITATARASGLLVVGPNCLGIASIVNRCSASTGNLPHRAGNVAVISHSGGLMNEVMTTGAPRGIGFSHVVSCGNEAGVTAADLIDFYVDDPVTDVVLCVMETVRDPAGFLAATDRALAARKPIVILKMGWSAKGARSAFTHTGAHTGTDAVYAAIFQQKGIIRANDIDELVDMGALLSASIDVLRKHRLERAAIIEISGGGKGLVSDTAAAAGVPLPDPSGDTLAALEKGNPDEIYPTNPIDTGGSWVQEDKAQVYPATLEAFATQPDVDIVVSRYTIPRTGPLGVLGDRVNELEAARAAHPDRLFPVLSRTCDQYCEEWETAIRERRIPFVQGYGRGLRALGKMGEYSRLVHGPREIGPEAPVTAAASAAEGARSLDAAAARDLLAAAGLPMAATPGGTPPGLEVVLGARRDAQFGPVVAFSLGGTFAEVLDDVALRLAPLSATDAAAMLDDIRGSRLLDAGPGRPAADRAAIGDALGRLADLMQKRPDVASIEVPAVVHEKGLTIADARVEVS